MHCSATAEQAGEGSSILFGLSGTGKTTLSADPKRRLVGDDEHCWTDDGIFNFNIEGGCYAKAIHLTREAEPQIFDALRFGAVLENVSYDQEVIAECPGTPSGLMLPRDSWADKAAYDRTAVKLAGLFKKNFEVYESGVTEAVRAAGPR